MRRFAGFAVLCCCIACLCLQARAQHSQKPLANDDVIKMVRQKLPESVIVSAIRATPGHFDTSPNELIRLHNAGVTEGELNAMMAASGGPAAPGTPASTADTPSVPLPPQSKSHMPKVQLLQGAAYQELPLEKTQLAETKTKPNSMASLAADSAVTQTLQTEVNVAAMSAATHMNSGFGGATMEQAGSVLSGVMSHRKPSVTYVWGVPNPSSATIVQTVSPVFVVDISRVIGANLDDYQPLIVKLTPAQNVCRIVGATEGKQDASSSPADWQVYSHFLEEPVMVKNQKLNPGQFRLSTASQLPAGEYAVVLRPTSKTKKFSGADVVRAQGDGLMFDAVWTFHISDDAE
jgi:hypothetical protein